MAFKKILLKMADSIGLSSKLPRRRLDAFLEKHATDKRTLDIGSGDGPYRRYFPNRIGTDIDKTPGVDVVADAHDLSMFRDGEFECVLSTEVLEHLENPPKAIREMHRVLQKGGKLVLTTRFVFPLHNIPGDYFRFTRYGLEHMFRDFSKVEIYEEANTLETVAVLFERIAFQTTTLWFKPLSFFWLLLSKITIVFSGIITSEYGEVGRVKPLSSIMTSGYYVVAI